MKKVISLLLTAMLLLSMLPATMAEGVEYIPAPYALDAERAGPKAYVEPVFYANGEGEPTIGVTYVGVIKADGKYFKDSNNNHELDPFEDWRLDPETRALTLQAARLLYQSLRRSRPQKDMRDVLEKLPSGALLDRLPFGGREDKDAKNESAEKTTRKLM